VVPLSTEAVILDPLGADRPEGPGAHVESHRGQAKLSRHLVGEVQRRRRCRDGTRGAGKDGLVILEVLFPRLGIARRRFFRQVVAPVYGVVGETTSYNTEYNAYSGYQPVETKTPEYGITHYTSETAVGVRYHRHLVLVASKHGADGAPIWQVQARSSGYSHDLRLVFPYMVAAARPYLGRSTGHEVDVTLTENSEEAALIRGES